MAIRNPIIDPRNRVFRHGKHKGEHLPDVFREDPAYLEFLIYESHIDGRIKSYLSRARQRLVTSSVRNDRGDLSDRRQGHSRSGKR